MAVMLTVQGTGVSTASPRPWCCRGQIITVAAIAISSRRSRLRSVRDLALAMWVIAG